VGKKKVVGEFFGILIARTLSFSENKIFNISLDHSDKHSLSLPPVLLRPSLSLLFLLQKLSSILTETKFITAVSAAKAVKYTHSTLSDLEFHC
jgi:hypothetical protein